MQTGNLRIWKSPPHSQSHTISVNVYVLEVFRYLHVNPARLRQPKNPCLYLRSNHGVYLCNRVRLRSIPWTFMNSFIGRLGNRETANGSFFRRGCTEHEVHKIPDGIPTFLESRSLSFYLSAWKYGIHCQPGLDLRKSSRV